VLVTPLTACSTAARTAFKPKTEARMRKPAIA
jgi:hypothetical protein